jgi:hypothetical protein
MNSRLVETPILLANRQTLTTGGYATYDSGALQAPSYEPLWIDEIRFYSGIPSGSKVTGTFANLGGALSVRMKLSTWEMTDGFVPIWLFAPAMQWYCETGTAVQSNTYYGVASAFTWRLAKPLFMPRGATFQIQARRRAILDPYVGLVGSSVPLTVAFAGRYADPANLPKQSVVPYVSAFTGDYTAAISMSSEQELKNKLAVPLNLQYLVGRMEQVVTVGGGVWPSGATIYPASDDYRSYEATVQIKSSQREFDPVEQQIPFISVFDAQTRAFNFKRPLGPAERLVATVAVGVTQGDGSATAVYIPYISYVGYRKEVVP